MEIKKSLRFITQSQNAQEKGEANEEKEKKVKTNGQTDQFVLSYYSLL